MRRERNMKTNKEENIRKVHNQRWTEVWRITLKKGEKRKENLHVCAEAREEQEGDENKKTTKNRERK